MIDAIYIHSCHKEIINGKLHTLLNNVDNCLFNKSMPIYIILDHKSVDLIKDLNVKDKKIVFINESSYFNKVSLHFHFLINYKLENYQRILNLEADCTLKDHFDDYISKDLSKTNNKWFIYGSKYYGHGNIENINLLNNKSSHAIHQKQHFNGVAVYNRTFDFIKYINQIFYENDFINLDKNYDFILYENLLKDNLYHKCIESRFILNLSHINDVNLNPVNFKSEAKIIHQKTV